MIFIKKLFFAVPVLFAVSACSAAPALTTSSVPDIPFTAEAEISYGGTECTAEIERSQSGRWEFHITEPYALEGLTMTITSDETKLSMLGIETAADNGSDAVSMAKAVAELYDAAAADGTSLSGTCTLGAYTIELDESGIPAALRCDPGKLTVTLKSFAPLPPSEPEAQILE